MSYYGEISFWKILSKDVDRLLGVREGIECRHIQGFPYIQSSVLYLFPMSSGPSMGT